MTNPFKTISIGLCPNFGFDDVLLSLSLLLRPWKYFDEKAKALLEEKVKTYSGKKHVFLFDSGRTSLYFLIKAMDVKSEDEVIIQAFTCSVVPGSIIQAGAKPVYVDIDKTINLDPAKLSQAVSSKTKAVIIQHTFGTAANIEGIKKLCDERNIPLVEDLAHGLGGTYQGQRLGSFGKAAFFSFGRDKVISGVWGGALATNDNYLAERLKTLTSNLPERDIFWTMKQLVYPPFVFLIINSYGFLGMGKIFHFLLRRAHVLSDALSSLEKSGGTPNTYYSGLPSSLCFIILKQWDKLQAFVDHRRSLAKYYASEFAPVFDSNSSYLRFNLEVDDPDSLRKYARLHNTFLGDWYNSVVAPTGVDLKNFGYILGSCPQAEELSKRIVNLPTCPSVSLKEAKKVVTLVKQWKLQQ